MAEIGVLELQIKDNASDTAGGLRKLAGALDRVRNAVGNAVGLDEVAGNITKLSDAVVKMSQNSAVKQITELGKSIKSLVDASKLTKISFDTSGITALKKAIGDDGLHLGQAGTQLKNIRAAMEGWDSKGTGAESTASLIESLNSLKTATTGLKDSSSALKEMAEAIKVYAEAASMVSMDGFSAFQQVASSVQTASASDANAVGENITGGITSGLEAGKSEAINVSTDVANAILDAVKKTLGIASPARKMIPVGRNAIYGINEGMISVSSTVQGTIRQIATDMVNSAQQIVQNADYSKINVADFISTPVASLRDRFIFAADASGKFNGQISAAIPVLREYKDTVFSLSGSKRDISEFASKTGDELVGLSKMSGLTGKVQETVTATTQLTEGLVETETAAQHAGETIAEAFTPARDIVKSTLKEFTKLEKDGTFSSWMYGPREAVPVTETFGAYGMTPDEEFEKLHPELYRSQEFYDNMEQSIRASSPVVEDFGQKISKVKDAVSGLNETNPNVKWIDNLVENSTELDQLKIRYDSVIDKLYECGSASNSTGEQFAYLLSEAQRLKEKIEELTAAEATQSSLGYKLSHALSGLGAGMKRLFPTVTNLVKRFKSMMIMRTLRYLIRTLAKGFSEGLQNVYFYSKAVGTSFAPAMDTAASALLQMKNSIGAAVAPLVQALIPVLQTVVNWVITAVNWFNQFFSLLAGQSSWTEAIPATAEAFTETTRAARQAAKETKELLADWDELNIIQNEGGSGGGGGNNNNTPDYQNMFRQVNTISDSVRDVVSFIEDHLGGLKGLLMRLGALILGWKFSKAFTGILGKLGKLVAGGALISIGLDLSYGAGFEAGKKGYFDPADILTAIGGVLATGIGGYMLGSAIAGPFGGKVGLVIGLGVDIMATLYGWIKGKEDALDAARWGTLHKTAEEIEEFVKKQFTFDVVAEITILDGKIKNGVEARTKLNEKIKTFNESLDSAIIKVDANVSNDEKLTAVLKAAKDAQAAIDEVNAWMLANREGLTITLKSLEFRDEAGNVINNDIMQKYDNVSASVQDYLTDIGRQLSGYVKKGELEGLTGGEQEEALELMKRQKRILSYRDEYEQKYKREIDLNSGRSKINFDDRDSVIGEMEREKQLISEWTNAARESVQQDVDNIIEMAAIARGAARDALEQGNVGTYLQLSFESDELLNEAQFMAEHFEEAVEKKLKPTKDNIRNYWVETLRNAFNVNSQDLDNIVMESTAPFDMFNRISPFSEALKHPKKEGIGATIRDWLMAEIGQRDKSGVFLDAVKNFGVNIWDVLSEGARKNLFMNTADILGSSDAAIGALMDAFGLTKEQLKPYADNYAAYIVDEVNDGVKKEVQNNPFTIPGLSYSAPENIDSETEQTIAQLAKDAQEAIDKAEDVVVTIQIVPEYITSENQWQGNSPVNADEMYQSNLLNQDDIPDVAYEPFTPFKTVDETIKAPSIDSSSFLSGLDELETNTRTTIEEIRSLFSSLDGISLDLSTAGNGFAAALHAIVPGKASGGFVRSGDLVMANENGNFEMMGKMGSQPVVANNQQIVTGISQGVAQANSGVESRLNTIESLLIRMLNKEFVAKAVPSSNWGAHNARSNDAYDKVTG